jgi:DNA-binding MarR family transcriptional regulator
LPTRSEIDAWRSFLRSHAKITRCLESELLAEQRLSLGAYDVLAQLAEAEDQRLRMAELAEAVLLSRSGVTRLVDRLERAGLVIRERVDGDGRGVVAKLTPAGAHRLGIAARTHLAGVVRHFVDLLDEQELATIARLTQRIADAQP